MRNINDVLTHMMVFIPTDPEYIYLINQLHDIKGALAYVPPEHTADRFRQVQNLLHSELKLEHTTPAELTGWKLDVMKVWTGNDKLGATC